MGDRNVGLVSHRFRWRHHLDHPVLARFPASTLRRHWNAIARAPLEAHVAIDATATSGRRPEWQGSVGPRRAPQPSRASSCRPRTSARYGRRALLIGKRPGRGNGIPSCSTRPVTFQATGPTVPLSRAGRAPARLSPRPPRQRLAGASTRTLHQLAHRGSQRVHRFTALLDVSPEALSTRLSARRRAETRPCSRAECRSLSPRAVFRLRAPPSFAVRRSFRGGLPGTTAMRSREGSRCRR